MKQQGYMMIDHRASPGMPEDVLRQAGISMPVVGEGKLFEADVLVCAHCGQNSLRNPDRTRERGSCQKCSGLYICDLCEWASRQPGYIHKPFVKFIDDTREKAFQLENGNLYLPLVTAKPQE